MNRVATVLLLMFAAVPLAACGLAGGGNAQVLTTTTILADMAKQLVGDRMSVGSSANVPMRRHATCMP